MKRILSFILALLTIVLLAACGKAEKGLIGTWHEDGGSEVYVFLEDGSGQHKKALQNANITYEVEGDQITIHDKTLWVFNTTKVYSFEVSGDTLRLTDGSTTQTFTRQEEPKE